MTKTFVIEEKYGFNKTTAKTYILDLIKGMFLSAVIGVPILFGILWFFEFTGNNAWLICWMFLTVVQLVITFIAPTFIMPLFNKFTPLKDGDLKDSIENYAKKYKFSLEIYPSIVAWEIFPHDYQSSLYAFSNKDNLNKFIETNYIFEK